LQQLSYLRDTNHYSGHRELSRITCGNGCCGEVDAGPSLRIESQDQTTEHKRPLEAEDRGPPHSCQPLPRRPTVRVTSLYRKNTTGVRNFLYNITAKNTREALMGLGALRDNLGRIMYII